MCETFLIKFFVRFKATMIYILLIPAVNMILVHAPIGEHSLYASIASRGLGLYCP